MSNIEELEIEKRKLELEKLSLENRELKKPWYKKSTYIGIILPAILTIISLTYALRAGFFDLQYKTYQVQKATLELEIKQFTSEKESLIIENGALLDSLNRIKDSLTTLNFTSTERKLKIDSLLSLLTENQGNLSKSQIRSIGLSMSQILDSIDRNLNFEISSLNRQLSSVDEPDKILGTKVITFSGRIIDAKTKKPIKGCLVELDKYDPVKLTFLGHQRTDEKGRFFFDLYVGDNINTVQVSVLDSNYLPFKSFYNSQTNRFVEIKLKRNLNKNDTPLIPPTLLE